MNTPEPNRNGNEKDGNNDNEENANTKENSTKPPYTVNAVLHFLQHELNRFEMERAHWELERAELKMLEYSLKQERAKLQRLKGEMKIDSTGDEPDSIQEESFAPIEVDATVPTIQSSQIYTKARSLLRQYLEEIGPKDKSAQQALDESELAVLDAADAIRNSNRLGKFPNGATDGENSNNDLDIDAVTALDEFAFLKDEKSSLNETIVQVPQNNRPKNDEEWNVDQNAITQLKEKYRSEKERKRANNNHTGNKEPINYMSISSLNNTMSINDDINIKDNFADQNNSDAAQVQWKIRFTLRSHFDSVRVMQFHPFEPVLVTASEDGTAKMWNLGDRPVAENAKDRKLLTECFKGHTDIVWAVAYHSSSNRLISGGADGTIRLWELGTTKDEQLNDPQLKLFEAPTEKARLRSLDLVSTETQQLLTAYSEQYAGILDLETDRRILEFDLKNLDEEVGEINKILSHPTMPVTITAGTDRRIRKLIRSSVAHVESISTLAADPNGLYLLSGCDDGSLRLWDMETRVCLQEIAVHRKKHDMAVMSVAFHPSRPLIGSAGADGLVKIFSSTQNIRDSTVPTNPAGLL
ncbi:Striatin-3 [Aphelenchoides besseyi]|nr:Striatin-3 [Aphelenchoides besseyi]